MNPRRQVLQVLEATTGGTRRHLVDLVTHLDPGRFCVSVACATRRDPGFLDDVRAMRARGVEVYDVPMVRAIRPGRDLAGLARLYGIMRRRRFDVVHTHSSKAGFLGRLAARLAGVPRVVHTPHVFPFEMDAGAARRRLYVALERLAARWCDRIVCVSGPGREAALRWRIAPAERLAVIENGIEEAAPPAAAEVRALRSAEGLREGAPVVGTVGRFARQKGYADLVRAAALVRDAVPDATFLLVGVGELRAETLGLIRRLSLGGACRIVDAPAPSAYYPLFDVFVSASLWEGLPYALLDAMAAGLPAVATRVGGVAEAVVDGETGLLVPPRDPGAMAAAVVGLLRDAERRRRFGMKAAARVRERYRLRDMVAKLETLYA